MSESLESFTVRSLRGKRRGAFQDLLALQLYRAQRADPLKKVLIVSEAVMYAGDKANVSIDSETLELMFLVSQSLSNVSFEDGVYSIPWAFSETEENYKKFIKPWIKGFEYHEDRIEQNREWVNFVLHWCGYLLTITPADHNENEVWEKIVDEYGEKCPYCEGILDFKDLEFKPFSFAKDDLDDASFVFEATHCLTHVGYLKLVNAFTSFALPKTAVAEAELSKLIDPEKLKAYFFAEEERREKETQKETVKEVIS